MNLIRSPELECSERRLPREKWRRAFRRLRGVIIDVHLLARNRHFDMIGPVKQHPGMLGIAMDADTAIGVELRGHRHERYSHS